MAQVIFSSHGTRQCELCLHVEPSENFTYDEEIGISRCHNCQTALERHQQKIRKCATRVYARRPSPGLWALLQRLP